MRTAQAEMSADSSSDRPRLSLLRDLGLDTSPLAEGDFELWPAERQVFLRGERLYLTKQEFDILHLLVLGANHVLSRDRMRSQVWGKPLAHVRDRSIDVVVRRLRKKLAVLAPERTYIVTHHGLGYRLDPEGRG